MLQGWVSSRERMCTRPHAAQPGRSEPQSSPPNGSGFSCESPGHPSPAEAPEQDARRPCGPKERAGLSTAARPCWTACATGDVATKRTPARHGETRPCEPDRHAPRRGAGSGTRRPPTAWDRCAQERHARARSALRASLRPREPARGFGEPGRRILSDELDRLIEGSLSARSPDYSAERRHLRRNSCSTCSWGIPRPSSSSRTPCSISEIT